MCWCDVVANAAASAGSYGQRIERAEGFAQGMNRYPTLARAEISKQHICDRCRTNGEDDCL